MPRIAGFDYEIFKGVLDDKWAVYKGITFDKGIPGAPTTFDEAHINLRTGLIEFYDIDSPNAKLWWAI